MKIAIKIPIIQKLLDSFNPVNEGLDKPKPKGRCRCGKL